MPFIHLAFSNTRVILEAHLRIGVRAPQIWCPICRIALPGFPFAAHPLGFLDRAAIRFVPDGICIFLALHDLQTQSLGNMESDVAMNKPGAWIVGFKGYDNVTAFGHENNVATGWVNTITGDVWWVTEIPRV